MAGGAAAAAQTQDVTVLVRSNVEAVDPIAMLPYPTYVPPVSLLCPFYVPPMSLLCPSSCVSYVSHPASLLSPVKVPPMSLLWQALEEWRVEQPRQLKSKQGLARG